MFWAMFRRSRSSSSGSGANCGHTGEAELGSCRILGSWFRCLPIGADSDGLKGNTVRV